MCSWVIDLDIKGFFDNLDHAKLLELLLLHTREKWVLLYVERWLKAGVELEGTITAREKGTPQGGVMSPLLANIYLHHAFDTWMEQTYEGNPFERYADDIIVHCYNREEAEGMLDAIRKRLSEYSLLLHPEKTKIVHCKNSRRSKEEGAGVTFTFLGFDFKPRSIRSKGGRIYVWYEAGISQSAQKKINAVIRESDMVRWMEATIESMAAVWNPKLRGWIGYYGKFRKWEMYSVFDRFNVRLARWVGNKYRLTGKLACMKRLKEISRQNADLFAHWSFGMRP